MHCGDAVPLTDATADALCKALDKIVRKPNTTGSTVTITRCDKQFQLLVDEVMDEMDIKMDYSDSGAHESVAEQNNRVMEEWHQTAMHRLPHKTTPKAMIEALMKETVKHLNVSQQSMGHQVHTA